MVTMVMMMMIIIIIIKLFNDLFVFLSGSVLFFLQEKW